MKNILRSGAVLALVLGLTGCGGKAGEAIGEMKKLKDEMCACKDKACADKVAEKFAKMGEKHKDTKATETQMKEAGKVAEEYGKCMMKAMGAGDMGAPPAGDPPPAAPAQ
jgi:hypothetical protein